MRINTKTLVIILILALGLISLLLSSPKNKKESGPSSDRPVSLPKPEEMKLPERTPGMAFPPPPAEKIPEQHE